MNKDHEQMHIDDPARTAREQTLDGMSEQIKASLGMTEPVSVGHEANRAKPPQQKAEAFKGIMADGRPWTPSVGGEMTPGPTSGWRRDKARERRLRHDDLARAESWSIWRRGGIMVISTLEMADAPDGSNDVILQWHISMSRGPGHPRVSDEDARAALAGFALSKAEEDNHHPGLARHFWMPLDPKRRVDCECKTDEETIVEPDGYKWTNPVGATTDPTECRGCEYERISGEPCSLHPKSGGLLFDGATPAARYDAEQRPISGNHVAIGGQRVPDPLCRIRPEPFDPKDLVVGDRVRIGDAVRQVTSVTLDPSGKTGTITIDIPLPDNGANSVSLNMVELIRSAR